MQSRTRENSWKKISKAVNEGTLVFQRSTTNANATGRERTETKETLDFGEDDVSEVDRAPGLEMTEQAAGLGVATGDIDLLNGTASPGVDSDFSIADDAEDMDDFVGNPGSPKPADATTLSNDGSFEPVSVEDEALVHDTSVTPPLLLLLHLSNTLNVSTCNPDPPPPPCKIWKSKPFTPSYLSSLHPSSSSSYSSSTSIMLYASSTDWAVQWP